MEFMNLEPKVTENQNVGVERNIVPHVVLGDLIYEILPDCTVGQIIGRFAQHVTRGVVYILKDCYSILRTHLEVGFHEATAEDFNTLEEYNAAKAAINNMSGPLRLSDEENNLIITPTIVSTVVLRNKANGALFQAGRVAIGADGNPIVYDLDGDNIPAVDTSDYFKGTVNPFDVDSIIDARTPLFEVDGEGVFYQADSIWHCYKGDVYCINVNRKATFVGQVPDIDLGVFGDITPPFIGIIPNDEYWTIPTNGTGRDSINRREYLPVQFTPRPALEDGSPNGWDVVAFSPTSSDGDKDSVASDVIGCMVCNTFYPAVNVERNNTFHTEIIARLSFLRQTIVGRGFLPIDELPHQEITE